MSRINFKTTSAMGIDIRKIECPSCSKDIFEMPDWEAQECVYCGNEFHGEINGDFEVDKYFLTIDPKTGIPTVVEQSEESEQNE